MNTMKQLITRFTILSLIVTLFQVNFALGGLSSLFNRQRLFQRTPVQQTNQNQQQQQQQSQQSHQVQQQQQPDHLIFAANSLSSSHFNPFNIRHDDLLRLNAAQKNVVKHQQMLNQHQEFAALNGGEPTNHISFEQASQPATYYSSQQPQQQQQQQQLGSLEQSSMLGHQYSASSHFVQPLISYQKQHIVPSIAQDPRISSDGHQQQHFVSNLDHSGSQIPAAIIEPSQTEIVDKIERHIGRQIEQGLKDSSPSGSEQRAASGDKESSASGGGEESAEEVEEPKVEKRKEEQKSEPEEHHHEENPPEAFEIHHKKGGKSFQYFHQGHHK